MKQLYFLAVLLIMSSLAQGQQWLGGEYFFDKDPGIGRTGAIKFTSTGNSDEILQTLEIDISSLSPGFHSLGIRLIGLSGGKIPVKAWSQNEYRIFYVSPPPATASKAKLDVVEYFFDSAPLQSEGVKYGNVTTTDTTMTSLGFEIPVDKLTPGFHSLGVRVRNTAGVWGLIEYRTFYIPTPKVQVNSEIVAAHYFINQDPGAESNKNIPIDVSKAIKSDTGYALPAFDVDISSLSKGFHSIGIRVKNSVGQWSLLDYRTFYIAPSSSERVTPKLVSAEYLIDPDLTSGLPLQPIITKKFAPVDSVSFQDEEFDITGLSFGKHKVAVRVKDEKGNYSFIKDTTFTVTDCPVFPVADFTYQALTKVSSTLGMCLPDSGLFTPNVKGGNAATTYSWDFDADGKEDVATKGIVKYRYTKVGTFKATLITSNGGKCLSKDSVIVSIESKPTTVPRITFRNDTLFSSIATNITWYDSQLKPIPRAKQSFYSPNVGGKYYATIGNAKGCESDTSIGFVYVPTLPTASTISTTYTVTEGDALNIPISFTGTAPWILYTKTNGVENTPLNITRSPYNWQVFAAGTYILDSLVDGKARKGKVSGSVTLVVKPFVGSTATIAGSNKEYVLTQIGDTAKVRISFRGAAPFTLYLTYENVERVINDIRDTFYIFKTFQQGTYKLTRVFDATGVAGKTTGQFTVSYKPIAAKNTAVISGIDTLRGTAPAKIIFTFTGKAPWTVLWKIGNEPFPQPLRINKSPDTLSVFKDGNYTLISVLDAEGNTADVSGVGRVVKRAVPLYMGSVTGNGSLNESDTVYITFKYNGNIPWTLIYGNDLGFVDTVLVTKNEYVAKVFNRGVYKIIKIIDGKSNIQSEIVTSGEAKVGLELITKEAFSPNGDGLNEFFLFKGLTLFTTNKLFIYNREGQSVYNAENYVNDWDGKDSRGKIVPDGVYYYTLKSSNTSGTPKEMETYGSIEIRR